jgi:hypothetical protein
MENNVSVIQTDKIHQLVKKQAVADLLVIIQQLQLNGEIVGKNSIVHMMLVYSSKHGIFILLNSLKVC